MPYWVSKVRMFIFIGVVASLAFSLPIYPASWAQPPVVKIMAQNLRNQVEVDFAKGLKNNLKMEIQGAQSVLTQKSSAQDASYTSQVMKTNFPFHAFGLHWKNISINKIEAEKYIQIQMRVSKNGKKWSSWIHASADSDSNADPKEQETFSPLIFTETSHYLQYRVILKRHQKVQPKVKDIKITVINSRDGQKIAKKRTLWDIITNKVNAMMDKPPIVTREQWGADESLRFKDGKESWPREYHRVSHFFVHHTDSEITSSTDPSSVMRGIYYYHAVTRNWGDIGYNAIIGFDGKIYEGRKGKDEDVLTPEVVGAGTYGFNRGGFSVALMGNFQDNPLTAKMHHTLVKLLAYEANVNKIDPDGKSDFVRDYPVSDPNIPKVDPDVYHISGHRDSKYTPGTLCPGDYVYELLPYLRMEVKAMVNAEESKSKAPKG
jgi:hypothetical protein